MYHELTKTEQYNQIIKLNPSPLQSITMLFLAFMLLYLASLKLVIQGHCTLISCGLSSLFSGKEQGDFNTHLLKNVGR